MGAALAGSCVGERLWVGEGRSSATRARADAAGLEEVADLAQLVERSDVIVSVCPPGAAQSVAKAVAGAGFEGTYVDVNATSPATSTAIATEFERYVDGSIVGPPPSERGDARLYLVGDEAKAMARLWTDGLFDVVTLEGAVGAASALKVAYAAWSKGTAALLLAVRAYARAEGIEGPLLAEWGRSVPGLGEQSELSAWGNAPKAWRFADELDEIARAFGTRGLPSGFGEAAAEVYRDLTSFRDATDVAPDDVFDALIAGDPKGSSTPDGCLP